MDDHPYELLPLLADGRATAEQARAVRLGRNLVVEAGAGSGKTAVLTNRVLAALLFGEAEDDRAPLTLRHLVVLTFTDKAARELQSRVGTLLDQLLFAPGRLNARPEDRAACYRARLVRARQDFAHHHIGTIHGFCRRLLTQHALDARVDPAGEPLEPDAAEELAEQAVEEVIARGAKEGDPALAHALGKLPTFSLRSLLLALWRERAALDPALADLPDAAPAADETPAAYHARLAQLARALVDAERPALERAAACWPAARAVFRDAARTLDALRLGLERGIGPDGDALQRRDEEPAGLRASLAALAKALGAAGRRAALDAAAARALKTLSDAPLASGREQTPFPLDEDPPLALGSALNHRFMNGNPAWRDALRTALNRAQFAWRHLARRVPLWWEDARDEDEAALRLAARVLHARVLRRYEALKGGALDFTDLVLRARHLLAPAPGRFAPPRPRLLERLRAQFRMVFVDEFQDTDADQWAVIRALVTVPYAHGFRFLPDRVFVVGDPKQSIYRFRGAEVEVFRGVAGAVVRGWDGEAPPEPPAPARGDHLALTVNFRSAPRLLATVNRLAGPLFEHPADLPGADRALEPAARAGYEPDWTPLVPGLADPGGNGATTNDAEVPHGGAPPPATASGTCTWLLAPRRGRGAAAEDDDEPSYDQAAREGAHLAAFLKECWLAPPHGRAPAPGLAPEDVAILVRRRRPLPAYETALRRAGLPAVVLGGDGFFDRPETRDTALLLAALLEPADDFSTVGLLRSPLCGLEDRALDLLHRARDVLGGRRASFQRALAAHDRPAVVALFDRAGEWYAGATAADGRRWRRQLALLDERLRRWRALLGVLGPAALLAAAFDEAGLRLTLAGAPDAAQAAANLEKLLDWARAHERRLGANPWHLLERLHARIDRDTREGQAELPADAAGVRLLTIHGAKGLEFRACIIPEFGASLPRGGGPAPLFRRWHCDGRPALAVNPQRLVEGGTVPRVWRQAQLEVEQRERAEHLRVCYVALTRAREHLALSGRYSATPPGPAGLERLGLDPAYERLLRRRAAGSWLAMVQVERNFFPKVPGSASDEQAFAAAAGEFLRRCDGPPARDAPGLDETIPRAISGHFDPTGETPLPDFAEAPPVPVRRDPELPVSASELALFERCVIAHHLRQVRGLYLARADAGVPAAVMSSEFRVPGSECEDPRVSNPDSQPTTRHSEPRPPPAPDARGRAAPRPWPPPAPPEEDGAAPEAPGDEAPEPPIPAGPPPVAGVSAARFGVLLHRMLELDLPDAALPAWLAAEGEPSDGELPAALVRHAAHARAAPEWAALAGAGPVLREARIERTLALPGGGQAVIEAVPDLLFRAADGGRHLVDYKTGATGGAPISEYSAHHGYRAQMELYAWTAAAHWAPGPLAVTLLYTAEGRADRFTMAADDLPALEAALAARVERLRAAGAPGDDAAPAEGALCASCDFEHSGLCVFQERRAANNRR